MRNDDYLFLQNSFQFDEQTLSLWGNHPKWKTHQPVISTRADEDGLLHPSGQTKKSFRYRQITNKR